MSWPRETGAGREGGGGRDKHCGTASDAEVAVERISGDDMNGKEEEHPQKSRGSSAWLSTSRRKLFLRPACLRSRVVR
jgi:hypothetical protein